MSAPTKIFVVPSGDEPVDGISWCTVPLAPHYLPYVSNAEHERVKAQSALAENIKWLHQNCKASVHITINDHTASYHSVAEEIETRQRRADIPDDVYAEMCRRNTIVDVQAYPDTPIGFFTIFHYDLETAVAEMRRVIEKDRRERPQPLRGDTT